MKIGLFKKDYGFTRILNQEKTVWEIFKLNKIKEYSLIIINSRLGEDESAKIRRYIYDGGCVLTDAFGIKQLFNKKISKTYITSISGKGKLFRNISSINIEDYGYKIKDANIGKINNKHPAIYLYKVGKGFIIALPFNLDHLMSDLRYKKTYLQSIYPPIKESVSLVSKGDLRRLIVNCFIYLHLIRNKLYFNLWYYPRNYESIFTYRVDLDILNENEMDNIISIIKKHKIRLSWFVNVSNSNNPNKLKELAKLNQDIQSHSYYHKIFDSFEENYDSLLKAEKYLSKLNKKPIGFTSPFAMWNENLGKVLEKLNYLYSSEFTLSYDDFPFYPENSKILQLPIYPACIGLFKMRIYSINKIKSYLNYLIEKQYKKQMPLSLYDHPNEGIGEYPEVLDFTLNKIKSLDNVFITDMTDFAKWWKKREKVRFNLINNRIRTNNNSNDIYLRIINPNYKEARIRLKNQKINLGILNYKDVNEFKDIKIRNIDILKSKMLFSFYYLKLLFKSIKRRILV